MPGEDLHLSVMAPLQAHSAAAGLRPAHSARSAWRRTHCLVSGWRTGRQPVFVSSILPSFLRFFVSST